MVDENYSNFTKTGPNKGIYQPDEPENHRKEKKGGKGAREKKLATLFSFYSVDFRDSFERQKTNTEGYSYSLTQGNLVFKNPGSISIVW